VAINILCSEHQLMHKESILFSQERSLVHSILIEISIPMKQIGLIKMCLNENYSKVHKVTF
jgi:hypothetical protein